MAEPPGGDYLGSAVLTHKSWNPESLLWLGCALMLALAPGAAVAGRAEPWGAGGAHGGPRLPTAHTAATRYI